MRTITVEEMRHNLTMYETQEALNTTSQGDESSVIEYMAKYYEDMSDEQIIHEFGHHELFSE